MGATAAPADDIAEEADALIKSFSKNEKKSTGFSLFGPPTPAFMCPPCTGGFAPMKACTCSNPQPIFVSGHQLELKGGDYSKCTPFLDEKSVEKFENAEYGTVPVQPSEKGFRPTGYRRQRTEISSFFSPESPPHSGVTPAGPTVLLDGQPDIELEEEVQGGAHGEQSSPHPRGYGGLRPPHALDLLTAAAAAADITPPPDGEQAPRAPRLKRLPGPVVELIKAQAEYYIGEHGNENSADITRRMINSPNFYIPMRDTLHPVTGQPTTLGDFIKAWYNVEHIDTRKTTEPGPFKVLYTYVNDQKNEIAKRSGAAAATGDAPAGDAGGVALLEYRGVPQPPVPPPLLPVDGGGDAEMAEAEAAAADEARPPAAVPRAPRITYVKPTDAHKDFVKDWIRKNYISAIIAWATQNPTRPAPARALMTPTYTEDNYIASMKSNFGDVNVNWINLKKAAVDELATELEQQTENPNVKLNKSAGFNHNPHAPRQPRAAREDINDAAALGDAEERFEDAQPIVPVPILPTPMEIPDDVVPAPRNTLRELLSHEPDGWGFEIPTYKADGKPNSELVQDIIGSICRFPHERLKPSQKQSLIRAVRKSVKLAYFTEDEPVHHLLQILSSMLTISIDTNIDTLPGVKKNTKTLAEVKNGAFGEYVMRNINYYIITKPPDPQRANGYTLWFKPILDMIIKMTETPELMFSNMKNAINIKRNKLLSNLSRKALLQTCDDMVKCVSNMNYLQTASGKQKFESVKKEIVADVGSILDQLRVLKAEQLKVAKYDESPIVYLDDGQYMKNTEGDNCFFDALAQIWFPFEAERGESHTSMDYKQTKRAADRLRTLAARVLYVASNVEKAISLADNDAVAENEDIRRFIDQANGKSTTVKVRILAPNDMDEDASDDAFVIREQHGDTYRLLRRGDEKPKVQASFEDWLAAVGNGVSDIPREDGDGENPADVDDAGAVVCEPPDVKASRLNIINKMKHINTIVDTLTSGWASQAARLTQKIITRADSDLLAENRTIQETDVQKKRDLQVARIGTAFARETCYVDSARRIPTVTQQQGSAVQKVSAKNALESYNDNKRAALYDWATGTGKTSAIWGEIFAAACRDVGHAYVSLTRWGTAQDIYSNVFDARAGNHILDIARVILPNCTVAVTGVTMFTKKRKFEPAERDWERESYGYINERTGKFEPAKIWNDVEKRVVSFLVKISNDTSEYIINVYLSTLSEWAEIAALEQTQGNPKSRKVTPKKSKWNWRTSHNDIREILHPILSNERRIFIVDEVRAGATGGGRRPPYPLGCGGLCPPGPRTPGVWGALPPSSLTRARCALRRTSGSRVAH